MERNEKICKIIDEAYEMLIKNEETLRQIALYYYYNRELSFKISDFVTNTIHEIFEKNLDFKSEDVKKMIENKIGEFITNFNIYYI